MLFAHDTEVALNAAAALVNTQGRDRDLLETVGQLDEFVREWGWTGSRRRDRAELDEVRALRPLLRRLWRMDEDALVKQVNGMLRDAHALPQLTAHGEWGYHWRSRPRWHSST